MSKIAVVLSGAPMVWSDAQPDGSTAVLAAVRGTEAYFNTERGTYRMVGGKGDNEWAPDAESGPHIRITEKVSKAEIGRIIDELMMRKPKIARDWGE